MSFTQLGISEDLNKGLKELGITTPSKIQEQAIPLLLEQGNDFIGKAQTGTGKTAAFGLPLLMHTDANKHQTQSLILAPTRELAQQIQKQLFRFTKYTDKIFTETVFGGEKIDRQIQRLQRTTHIVVATPGRLVDLIKRKAVDIRYINTIVLDEADEMLSMGFKKDLDFILGTISSNRNIWLFSATMPQALQGIVKKYLSPNALQITVDKNDAVNTKIAHQFVVGEEANKVDTMTYFLKGNKNERGIIFSRTKVAARSLTEQLLKRGFEVGVLEGDMQQKERDKVMRAFKNKKLNLLVATDVAARGIDVANLAFVLHYQLPDQSEYYVHRSGRTARGGKTGISIAFVDHKEVKFLRNLEKELGIRFTQLR
ncbi:DEAD/DEAH box helicase [Aquimarina agarilytica]|uniref:DEAD/DEAH box helicase n=1 Tax=Aquimarina agarilytica TaxID=1087449 RepID=UPI000288FC17|nr:DEAD/DEAH box helicase [Aquimarina agarilytica]